MRYVTRRGMVGSVVCAATALFVACARADDDHDRARLAVERGEALPLVEILTRVRPLLGGEVVGVSFEREDGRWIYEFRVIATAGRLLEVHVDAATAEILKLEAQ